VNDQVAPAQVFEVEAKAACDPVAGGPPHLQDFVTVVMAPVMAISGTDGRIRARGAQGIYVNDVRALSRLEVRIDGHEPLSLGFDPGTGPTIRFDSALSHEGAPDPDVLVEHRRTMNRQGVTESFTVTSYGTNTPTRRFELRLGCDLAGIGTVRSGASVPALEAKRTGKGLAWQIDGRCTVEVSTEPHPASTDPSAGAMSWDLCTAAPATVNVYVGLVEDASSVPVQGAPAASRPLVAPEVDYDDHRLQKLLDRSIADLDALRMVAPDFPDEPFFAAGAPWYLTLFGRDSLWAARMMLPLGTEMALGTLKALARRQGTKGDPVTGEQPGKILHELRRYTGYDSGVGPSRHSLPPVYYGTVDATALWVCVLHDSWRWGAPPGQIEPLLGTMEGCLSWLRNYGIGPDGFVTYIDESGRGISNQGWKDSQNGVQSRVGKLAKAPIALCEVQGYAYEAAMGGADLLDAFGRRGAAEWRSFASRLSERFRRRFWVTDETGPFPAIALDADGRAVDSATSNMGHLLGTGIVNADEAEVIAARLGLPDMDCGFGLRTLSGASAGFNPVSYHCGSVWAHDTAIAISGLAREGGPNACRSARSLTAGLLAAAEGFQYRLPELYSGAARDGRWAPSPYPAACRPQAWSAAASVALLGAIAGMRTDVPAGRIHFRPICGAGTRLTVRGLSVGGNEVTVRVGEGGASVEGLPAGAGLSVA
jgi:glycogen debranching enzyme